MIPWIIFGCPAPKTSQKPECISWLLVLTKYCLEIWKQIILHRMQRKLMDSQQHNLHVHQTGTNRIFTNAWQSISVHKPVIKRIHESNYAKIDSTRFAEKTLQFQSSDWSGNTGKLTSFYSEKLDWKAYIL